MFNICRNLITIPWNNFNIDTSQCISTRSMFQGCYSLTSLNLSSMDTSSCTLMSDMFCQCDSLITLDISGFDTSNVTDMSGMFDLDANSYLQEITCLNGFDMTCCSNIKYMFRNCDNYIGEPLHFKNVKRSLDFSNINGTQGVHYVIDSYLD